MQNHEKYMRRCLELAKLGSGNTAPNPMVGAVVVHNDRIIGEGYHRQYGQAHAEVNAINAVKNRELLKKSTIYVNLEPCAHFGKTPPCADLITKMKIPRVVIGCVDTFAKVSGKGIEKLRQANCEVKLGVLEQESQELNKRFFTFHSKKRPYIILKWAETIDGFIDIERAANEDAKSYWITNLTAKKLVHKWRTEEAAFMIGTNTAINDNPQLTVREWLGRNPVRIVIDNSLRLPSNLRLFDHEARTIVFNSQKNTRINNIEFVKIDFKNTLQEILNVLYSLEIQSIMVEGGSILLNSFIENNLWDEARIFVGNKKFYKGVKAPVFNANPHKTTMIGDSKLMFFKKS